MHACLVCAYALRSCMHALFAVIYEIRLFHIRCKQLRLTTDGGICMLFPLQVTFNKGFFRYSLPTLRQNMPNLQTAILRLVS